MGRRSPGSTPKGFARNIPSLSKLTPGQPTRTMTSGLAGLSGEPLRSPVSKHHQLNVKYRRDIDGLRCIAIVPVVLCHAGAVHFAGGFIGVDIFFVISGFLITSIILREIGRDRFTIVGFYERRCRRILPALIVLISSCVVIGYFTLLPGQYSDFAKSAIAALLFVSNGFFSFGFCSCCLSIGFCVGLSRILLNKKSLSICCVGP
jgi:hypothetical protein